MTHQANQEILSKKVAGKLNLLAFIEDETRAKGESSSRSFASIVREVITELGNAELKAVVKKPDQVLLATGEQGVIYPPVIVSVNGVKCRALLDTGAGSSYISNKLKQSRQIDMMLSTVNKQIEIYNVQVNNLKGDFKLEIDASKADRGVLLSVKNPRYQDVLKIYPHLQGITMDDVDQKPELPVHLIFGASEYAKIKTDTKAKAGKSGEPVGEHTRLGWTLIWYAHVSCIRMESIRIQDTCSLLKEHWQIMAAFVT
eukprot:gene17914-19691_t